MRRDSWGLMIGLMVGIVAGVWALGCSANRPAEERPNLLLISMDTTRADRLGLYGYQHDTSRNLDRLARESVLYTGALSTTSWTPPAHASLFTGKFPSSHGARFDPEGSLVIPRIHMADELMDRNQFARARELIEGCLALDPDNASCVASSKRMAWLGTRP
jgi:hypothetical protein